VADQSTRLSPTALERRVKRWLLTGPFECHLPVAPGLEPLVVVERLDLGLAASSDGLVTEHGGVTLDLDHTRIMRANLSLRTASRVLLRLGSFPASSPEMLYDRARKLDWLVHLGFANGYRLRVSSRRSKLQAGDQVTDTIASAVARHMREHGLYPKPDDGSAAETPAAPRLEFHVRLLDDRCTVSLNTSGEHLHRRGVRTHVATAPVRETVAAAMVLSALTGIEHSPDVVVDPFCGSGTLLIETGDVLTRSAPGRRRGFAFQEAAWYRPGRWREVLRQAQVDQAAVVPLPPMLGLDVDARALDAARSNLEAAGYGHVELLRVDSTTFDYAKLGSSHGLVIGNAPFGVRLGDRADAAAVLTGLLDRLAASGGRWRLCLLTQAPGLVVDHPAVRGGAVRNVTAGGLAISIVTGMVGV
jgi:putative N6-adenine-specific DNA methylase